MGFQSHIHMMKLVSGKKNWWPIFKPVKSQVFNRKSYISSDKLRKLDLNDFWRLKLTVVGGQAFNFAIFFYKHVVWTWNLFFLVEHHLGVLFDTHNMVIRRLENFLGLIEVKKWAQKQLLFAKIEKIPLGFLNQKG